MKMLKPFEAAEVLNVSVSTLQRWDREGTLYAFRTPTNRRYYTKEQLDMFLFDKGEKHSMSKDFYKDLMDQVGFLNEGEFVQLEQFDSKGTSCGIWGIEKVNSLDVNMFVLGQFGSSITIKVLPFDDSDNVDADVDADDLEEYFEGWLESSDNTWVVQSNDIDE